MFFMNKDRILLQNVVLGLSEILTKSLEKSTLSVEIKEQIEQYLAELQTLLHQDDPKPSIKLFSSTFQLINNPENTNHVSDKCMASKRNQTAS